MRFRYLREPLFLCCTVGYFANRLWLKPSFWHAYPFLRNYLDDLLFFPVAFPILLFLHRVFRLRDHNFHPRIGDCLLYLILWSFLFEGIFPRFFHRGVADPLDALCYAIGAFVFMGALHFRARCAQPADAPPDDSLKPRVRLHHDNRMSGRWIIVPVDEPPFFPRLAWSGSSWVPIGGSMQVCNFGAEDGSKIGNRG